MDIQDRLSEEVRTILYNAIADAKGNEVFAAGTIDSDGLVTEVVIAARGHETAVLITPFGVAECDVLIHNHPSGLLRPSDADLNVASGTARGGKGFYIINNDVSDIYVVVEPIAVREKKLLDVTSISGLLEAGGALDALSEHFEERPTQIALARIIAESFNTGSIGVFEAGTGVGKSYAYLLPAMLWALDNRERVVISTGTINLQQQLIEKDIPAAEQITGRSVKAVLLKGRQNYVCRRRLSEAVRERDLFEEEAEEMQQLASWAESSSSGSRSELSSAPSENTWTRICSEADACMGMRCAFRENCFVMQVRKDASDANLLIVNHHLLFADLEARMAGAGYEDTAVLPPFNCIIFDEAHGMEDAATSFFSEYFTRFKILKQVNLLYRVRRGAVAGHLLVLEKLSIDTQRIGEAMTAAGILKTHLDDLETAAGLLLENGSSWRLSDASASRASALFPLMVQLRADIAGFTGIFREIIDGIPEDEQGIPAVWETKQILRRLEFAGTLCKNFCEWEEKRDTVFWIEKKRLTGRSREVSWYYRFVETPLSIAPVMIRGVFEPFKTVVCTSATIRIGNSFSFWMNRTGVSFLEEERVLRGEFPSPFPYNKNVLLAVVQDAPMPDQDGFQPFIETAIVSLIQASAGRSLVLFTAYESLKAACDTARRELAPLGIQVFKQGDDDRSRLLESFRADESSVLFATDSFWEGIDVPGSSLSQVIIVKLPFSVPNDPVLAARAEAIERAGGNPFMDLSLPEAVIRFRQGFGRLMRRKTDRGVVSVLDRRLLEKRYGRIFLESLPETKRVFSRLQDTVFSIERFLFG